MQTFAKTESERRAEAIGRMLDKQLDRFEKNPEEAKRFLAETGIWDKAGNLTPEYGGKPVAK